MLVSADIKNFQAHKRLNIKFAKGVNTIIGPSDKGKSAVIRAIRWCMRNTPDGMAHIRHGAKYCSVILEFKDGKKTFHITRYRDKTSNNYILKENGKEQTFSALGRSTVPPEIEKRINVSETDIQSQHDRIFLLSETAGEVAKKLNQVADLSKIDTSLKNINSMFTKETQNKTHIEHDLESKKKEIEDYKYVPKAEGELEYLENLERTKTALSNRINACEKLLDEVRELKKERKEINKMLKGEKELLQLIKLQRQTEELDKKTIITIGLLTDIKELKSESKRLKTKIKTLDKTFHELMPNQCPLCGK